MGRQAGRLVRRSRTRRDLVRAAGGILVRQSATGLHEVALVHRPDRDDWSLPKGKLDPGESYEDCALREVLEETGYRCALVRFVGFTEYRDGRGRTKEVGYWLMDVLEGEGHFCASEEVDELQWLQPDRAVEVLTYEHDRALLSSLDFFTVARSG